jgi:hypothetical protein
MSSSATMHLLRQLNPVNAQTGFVSGDRVPIPTGIKIHVTCDEIRADAKDPNRRYMNRVTCIEYTGNVIEKIDREFSMDDVIFNDWGISIVTKDGEWENDKFTFFYTQLPFKVSRMMTGLKSVSRSDRVHIKGSARVYYATIPVTREDGTMSFVVKPKFRFDSRFKKSGEMEIDANVGTIRSMYLVKLKRIKDHPSFNAVVKGMIDKWSHGFVKEADIMESARKFGIDIDPKLVTSAFLGDDVIVFYYLQSLITGGDIYYYAPVKTDFKYIIFVEPTKVDMDGKTMVPRRSIVYDVKLSTVYFLQRVTDDDITKITRAMETNNLLFLDQMTIESTNKIIGKMKTDNNIADIFDDLSREFNQITS